MSNVTEWSAFRQHQKDTISQLDITEDQYKIMLAQQTPLVKEIRKETDNIENSLSVITYDAYIENFLVLHIGYQTTNMRFTIQDWIDFAGSPFKEVILLGRDGKPCYHIPSLLPHNSYQLLNTGKDTEDYVSLETQLGDKMHTIALETENYKVRGAAMRSNLYNELLSRFSPEVLAEHRKKWNDFLDFLGIGPNCKVDANGNINTKPLFDIPHLQQNDIQSTQDAAVSLFG